MALALATSWPLARSLHGATDVESTGVEGNHDVQQTVLQRIANGNADAVRECLEQYGGLVWSLARRFSPSAEDAEDSAQEIFTELWKCAERFDPGVASEATFIAMVARRRLIDRNRARNRRIDPGALAEGMDPATFDASQEESERSDEVKRVMGAVQQLSPDQQKVLRLSVEGYSHERIATATGLPLGTVKTHIRRGLQRVRRTLEEAGETPSGTVHAGGNDK